MSHGILPLTASVILALAAVAGGCAGRGPAGEPYVGPDALPGDGAVSGVAQIHAGSTVLTAAARLVQLVPKTPETTRWLRGLSGRAGDPEKIGLLGLGPHLVGSAANPEPPAVRRAGRGVYGYGAGRFEFRGVAPGDYYVVFHVDPYRPSYAEVKLAPGAQVTGLRVIGAPGEKRR